MTKLFARAVQRAQNLPPDLQDEIARIVLSYAGEDDDFPDLTAEEEEAVARSMAAAARGEFATDEQVRAVWAKHGL